MHVLLDWVGSAEMDDNMLAAMRDAGVQVRQLHPPHWSHPDLIPQTGDSNSIELE